MINREKAMTDAINAITRLDFHQLITLNASLSEHMFNCVQESQLKKEEPKKEATALN